MSKSLISIIVPIYNVEKYLARCLESLISQTLKDIEIICVDDGSTDSCAEILQLYASKDKRVKVVSQNNAGLSGARNTGLKHSSSPYVTFIDSDDWVDPQTYQIALLKMLEDEEIDFVSWGIMVEYEDIDNADDWVLAKNLKKMALAFNGKQKVTDNLRSKTIVSACNKLYKMSLITKHQLKFPENRAYEDVVFWWMYAAWAKYGFYLDSFFYKYFRWSGATSKESLAEKSLRVNDRFLMMESIINYYKKPELVYPSQEVLAELFLHHVLSGLEETDDVSAFKLKAYEMSKAYNFTSKAMEKKLHRPELTWLEKFFSIKNKENKKIICILGFKIKLNRKIKNKN